MRKDENSISSSEPAALISMLIKDAMSKPGAAIQPGTIVPVDSYPGGPIDWRTTMGRYALLWLLGVPIPVLLLIWAFGGMH